MGGRIPSVVHGGGLSLTGLALLAAIVAGAVATVLRSGRVARGRVAGRRATGSWRAGDGREPLGGAPGFDRRPVAVRARRATGSDDRGRQGRDERR